MNRPRIIRLQTNPYASRVPCELRLAEGSYTPGERQEKHAHSYTSISFVLAGSLQETVGKMPEYAFPFSTVIKPCGTEHTDHFGDAGARMLSVQFPGNLVAALKDWDSSLSTWRWVHGGLPARLMLRLLKAYRRPATTDAELEDCVYEILASLPSHLSPTSGADAPRWIQLVKQELEDTFADGVRVHELAARAEVHPVYLARQFRRHMGCSITDYRRLLKARAAAQSLTSSNDSFAAAATQWGFADQSHLGRVFKSVTGLTPLDYRRLGTSDS
jgi:AraC family transcriptional regulator